jgi:hypothetical protein
MFREDSVDDRTFDAVARAVSAGASRRQALRLLAIGTVAALLPRRGQAAPARQGTECEEGLADCDGSGVCTSLLADANNCGTCGTVCASGVCEGGVCTQAGCADGLTDCDGSGVCTSLLNDATNCGTCGTVCPSGVCDAGSCAAVGCEAGLIYCEALGGCYDLQLDPNNCGACGTVCSSGVCDAGVCALDDAACEVDLTFCADVGACVDLSSDPNHCGACGAVCPSGTCIKAVCTPLTCEAGLTYCEGDGACYDLASDATHCGACDVDCATAGGTGAATVECRSGVCVQTSCATGFANCSGGLECTDLATDPNHCGACGTACESGICTNGVCTEPATTPATPSPTTTPATDDAGSEQEAATGADRPRRDRSSRTRGTGSAPADGAPGPAKPAKVKKVKPATGADGPEPVLAWPFEPEAGEWTIVNGYRAEDQGGNEGATPSADDQDYRRFAFAFAVCRGEDVDEADGTCALGPATGSDAEDTDEPGWDAAATRGANVLSPVDGTVAWTAEASATCQSLGIDIKGHAGYRLALFNVEGHPQRGESVKQGKRIGKVAKDGCEGGDVLTMVLYRPQAGAADDPEAGREGVPFAGDWVIDGCEYPDDKRTVNQYRGVLVPCKPEDEVPASS